MLSKCNCVEITAEMIIESTASSSRIILDIREPIHYEKSHIKDSINLLTSSLLLRRLQRGSLTIISLLPDSVVLRLDNDTCDTVILCDEDSSTEEMSRNLSIIVAAMKRAYPKKNIYFLESKCYSFSNYLVLLKKYSGLFTQIIVGIVPFLNLNHGLLCCYGQLYNYIW